MGDGERKIVATLVNDSDSLVSVVLKIDDFYYICPVTGPNAMVDDGPYPDLKLAIAVARIQLPYPTKVCDRKREMLAYTTQCVDLARRYCFMHGDCGDTLDNLALEISIDLFGA